MTADPILTLAWLAAFSTRGALVLTSPSAGSAVLGAALSNRAAKTNGPAVTLSWDMRALV